MMFKVQQWVAVVLVTLPLCSTFSPPANISTCRQRDGGYSQFAATNRRTGDNKEEKPVISERIRDAALSIIALSAPILLKDPLENTPRVKPETDDDLRTLFGEDEDEGRTNKKVSEPRQIVKAIDKPSSVSDSRRSADEEPRIRSADTNKKSQPTVPVSMEDSTVHSMNAKQEDVKVETETPKRSWSDLLVKDESTAMTAGSKTRLQRESMLDIPTKEELRIKALKAMKAEAELPILDAEAISSVAFDTPVTTAKEDAVNASLQPQLSPAVSTAFGKPLAVVTKGLQPLRQWPKPEPEHDTAAS